MREENCPGSISGGTPAGYWAIQGLGIGMVFIPLQSTAFATLPPQLRTDGSSLLNLTRSVGSSIGISIMMTLLSRNTPPERQGSTMGLMMASNAVGRILAPPLFGLIYARVGHDAPWYVGAAMIGLVVLVALQAVRLSGRPAA